MSLLEVRNLRTSFFTDAGEVKAVNGISFNLDRGKVLGIVGESGSGKSVTAYSIMQILAPTAKILPGSSIKLDGQELVGSGEKVMRKVRGNKVSIIFQDPMTSLNPTYTIGHQLMEAIRLHTNRDKKQAYDRACYLALAMYSGRRKSELCRFRVSDFDDDKLVCDGALYKSSPIKTKGRGGGKYIACYTLAKKFKPYLQMWLDERKRIGLESEWLFPLKANPAEHIGVATANSWANAFTRLSGRDFYAHSIRHYFTTSLARAGIPDGVIQSIVAWESSDMVRLYTDIEADEQIGMYFSNGDISVPDKKGFADM